MKDLPEVGAAVVYRSHPGAAGEDGVVTGHSAQPGLVFVRYRGQHPGADGKATPVSMLEPVVPRPPLQCSCLPDSPPHPVRSQGCLYR